MACPQLQQIQAEISELRDERSALQEELRTASPGQKPGLVGQIKRLNSQIALKTRELNLCLAQNPPPPPSASPTNHRVGLPMANDTSRNGHSAADW